MLLSLIESKVPLYKGLAPTLMFNLSAKEFSSPHSIFMDGACNNNNVGAAFIYFFRDKEILHQKLRLSKNCNNLQAELLAVCQAIHWIWKYTYQIKFNIITDSRAVIDSFKTFHNKHPLIDSYKNKIFNFQNSVSLTWIQGHLGHPGNERADQLARGACLNSSLILCNRISTTNIKCCIFYQKVSSWQDFWHTSSKGRVLHSFLPDVSQRLTNKYITIDPIVSQFLSGHFLMKSYLYPLGQSH